MSKRTMQEVVAEFNQLSGQNIKRFATTDIGEKRIAALKAGAVADEKKQAKAKSAAAKEDKPVKQAKTHTGKAERTWKMASMTVDGHPYRSIKAAFDTLGLPLNKHGKFRLKLKATGKETFEHEGKKYHFVLITQEQLL